MKKLLGISFIILSIALLIIYYFQEEKLIETATPEAEVSTKVEKTKKTPELIKREEVTLDENTVFSKELTEVKKLEEEELKYSKECKTVLNKYISYGDHAGLVSIEKVGEFASKLLMKCLYFDRSYEKRVELLRQYPLEYGKIEVGEKVFRPILEINDGLKYILENKKHFTKYNQSIWIYIQYRIQQPHIVLLELITLNDIIKKYFKECGSKYSIEFQKIAEELDSISDQLQKETPMVKTKNNDFEAFASLRLREDAFASDYQSRIANMLRKYEYDLSECNEN